VAARHRAGDVGHPCAGGLVYRVLPRLIGAIIPATRSPVSLGREFTRSPSERRLAMSRYMRRSVLVFLSAGVGICSLMVSLSGQSSPSAKPTTARGDWPHYTADNNGTRYSPLDQI